MNLNNHRLTDEHLDKKNIFHAKFALMRGPTVIVMT